MYLCQGIRLYVDDCGLILIFTLLSAAGLFRLITCLLSNNGLSTFEGSFSAWEFITEFDLTLTTVGAKKIFKTEAAPASYLFEGPTESQTILA